MESPSTDKDASSRIWWVISVLFLGALLLGRNSKDIKQFFTDLNLSWQLRPYEQQIKTCLEEKEKTLNGEKIIGLEYSCAIQVASTIYAQDRELAIKLCIQHQPFGAGENVMRLACASSLEKQAVPSSATTSIPVLEGQSVTSTKRSDTSSPSPSVLFENTKYHTAFAIQAEVSFQILMMTRRI